MTSSEQEDRIRVHALISGRVQGVCFRLETRSAARIRGINGWVRNLADGRVEAVFEGPRCDVDAMVGWCRKGPPGARVTDVEVKDENPGDPGDPFDAFHITG